MDSYTAVIADLTAKREAIDVVIGTLRMLQGPTTVPAPTIADAVARHRNGESKPRVTRQVKSGGAGTSTQCAEQIERLLTRAEHRSMEGKALRAAVAKALNVDVDDEAFAKAVTNALTQLRLKGRLSRMGTLWTLAES